MLNTRNHRDGVTARRVPDAPEAIITTFASKNGVERQCAREKLVAIGKDATPALVDCLADPRRQVRWEAAKTLSEIKDPAASRPLVATLEDKDGDVRWLVAVALAAIGRDALQPLLVALIEKADSDYVLQGGHHVCHELARTGAYPIVKPVLDAIGAPEPRAAVPPAAYEALHRL